MNFSVTFERNTQTAEMMQAEIMQAGVWTFEKPLLLSNAVGTVRTPEELPWTRLLPS